MNEVLRIDCLSFLYELTQCLLPPLHCRAFLLQVMGNSFCVAARPLKLSTFTTSCNQVTSITLTALYIKQSALLHHCVALNPCTFQPRKKCLFQQTRQVAELHSHPLVQYPKPGGGSHSLRQKTTSANN